MTEKVINISQKQLKRVEAFINEEIARITRRFRKNMSMYKYTHQKDGEDYGLELSENYSKSIVDLQALRFKIRNIIAEFTYKTTNAKVAKIAELTTKLDTFELIMSKSDIDTQQSYGQDRGKTLMTPGLSEADVDGYVLATRIVKSEIQRLKDSCNGSNSQKSIVLPKQLWDALISLGFIS